MLENIEEPKNRLLNLALYPKPAANRCLAIIFRSMLPSLEALSPGLALILAMCNIEYEIRNMCSMSPIHLRVMARRLFARPPTRPIRLGACLLVVPS